MLLVAGARHHPKRQTSSPQFAGTVIMMPVGWLMSCIGIVQMPIFGIKDSIEAGDKHSSWNIGIEKIVDARQYLARRSLLLSSGADHCARGSHYQGGRYPFVGDIAYDDTQATILKRQKIVEVATDLAGRLVVRYKLPARGKRHLFRQEGALNSLSRL